MPEEPVPPMPCSLKELTEQIERNLNKRSRSYVDDSHVFVRVILHLCDRLQKVQSSATLAEAVEIAKVP